MSAEAQRVVVIQDASRDVSPRAIRWVLNGLSLRPGDRLTLLSVLHQEVARKLEEYQSNEEIVNISNQCDIDKIDFHIEVHVGPSPKMVAIKAVRSLKATWVILDRQMKKDKKYFMERLSCGISRIKRDNTIERLTEPKAKRNPKLPTEKSITGHVTYDEMIPGTSSKKTLSPQTTSSVKEQGGDSAREPSWNNYKKSISFSRSSSTEQLMTATVSSMGNTEGSSSSFTEAKYSPLHFQEGAYTNTERETAGEQSSFSIAESEERGQEESYNTVSPDEQQKQNSSNNNDRMGGSQSNEEFKNSICSICKNRRPKTGWKRDFTYAELHAATEGFSPKNFLSEGGFGSVYRGELKGRKIAVKQHKNASFQGEKEFKSEVHVLSKARHENLVMLLGSCSEGSHRLLVYEYVCNGSLDQHLSKHARRPLSWDKRMKIAMGAAKGLQYLHENNIIHRDMRPNNILVTHDHESLLGDFGLARTQRGDSDNSSETRVVGTLGYLAPEYAECGKVSSKTDVYAFGVVLLQLITGLRTTDKTLAGKSLVGWARPLLKDRNYPDLIDQRIVDSHDVHQLFGMVRLAEYCLGKDPHKRLSMNKVVHALIGIMEGKSIVDFSPALSDSVSSIPDSPESQDDGSLTTETTSVSSLATSFSSFATSTSSTSQMSGRLPSSPATQAYHSGRSSTSTFYGQSYNLGSGKNHEKKRHVSQYVGEVLYDEMID